MSTGIDPSYLSRLERGLITPPTDRAKLERYGEALGLAAGTEDWETFMDLAAVAANRLPPDLLSDKRIGAKLPILFRTLRGQRLDDEQLEKLINLLRGE
jgi:transcriptional regulator with XRE-family HTH domain